VALNVEIVGVSFDTPTVNQEWAEDPVDNGVPDPPFQYELWSDIPDKTLAAFYGAGTGGAALRITRLIGGDGELLLEYGSINVSTSPQDLLSDCRALFGP
jgi:alkyl hydroperoxide reductase subunit AhpC